MSIPIVKYPNFYFLNGFYFSFNHDSIANLFEIIMLSYIIKIVMGYFFLNRDSNKIAIPSRKWTTLLNNRIIHKTIVLCNVL